MYRKRNQDKIRTCVTVTHEECNGNAEKMVRRFIKKVKREGIVEEYRQRSHFIKPTVVRAERKRAKKRLIEKVNRKREELFSLKSPHKRRR
jgi:ribosomal protein S21